jgi:hypothetical protein
MSKHSTHQILKAFILRKATFLADDFWVTMPFHHRQTAPLQSLLSVAASIPGILEKIDAIAASHRLGELRQSIAQLEAWHTSFLESSSEPLYWRCTVEHDCGGRFPSLWYRGLSTANVFIYFWTFHLICLVNIGSLLDRFPISELPEENQAVHGAGTLRDQCLELSTRIYQSMEFILQPGFMLYGISSADFPLQTACGVLHADAGGRKILDTLDPSIVMRSKVRDVQDNSK